MTCIINMEFVLSLMCRSLLFKLKVLNFHLVLFLPLMGMTSQWLILKKSANTASAGPLAHALLAHHPRMKNGRKRGASTGAAVVIEMSSGNVIEIEIRIVIVTATETVTETVTTIAETETAIATMIAETEIVIETMIEEIGIEIVVAVRVVVIES